MKYAKYLVLILSWYTHATIPCEEKSSYEMEQFFKANAEQFWYARCKVCKRLVKYQKADIFAHQQPNSPNVVTVDTGAQLFKQGHHLSGWSIVCNNPVCKKNIEIEKK